MYYINNVEEENYNYNDSITNNDDDRENLNRYLGVLSLL